MKEMIIISKESLNRFNLEKNVESIKQEELAKPNAKCPIDDGANLCSDELLKALFNTDRYAEPEDEQNGRSEHVVLGYVLDVPVIVTYWQNRNMLDIDTVFKTKVYLESPHAIDAEITQRITDGLEGTDIRFDKAVNGRKNEWHFYFYYI